MSLPPPPVPAKLREMLMGYPEHIDRLQADLNRVVRSRVPGTPMLEQAIWALEEALSYFAVDARETLKAAEASGDSQARRWATLNVITFGHARANMGSMSELTAYFDGRKP